jgi:hypothetical protein
LEIIMPIIDRRFFLGSCAATSLVPVCVAADAPYADAVMKAGEPPLPQPGSFTMAVLPDTQNYSEKYPQTYLAQTQWIVDNQAKRNIVATLHLGDITNRNTVAEWKNAVAAMKQLEGKVPYMFCPGNHDYSQGGGCKDRTSLINDYFPLSHVQKQSTFAGVYDREPDRVENNYHLLNAGGRRFLILALEFGPRKDVVRWANEVVAKHKDREVILITHAFIYSDETRYDWKKYGAKQKWNPHAYPVAKATGDDVTDGQELWERLISKHENFILTLNGHVLNDGLGKVITSTPAGREVPQLLVNFQMKPNGGDGWLRLLEFCADKKTVNVFDYSPVLKQRNESVQNQFVMKLAAV